MQFYRPTRDVELTNRDQLEARFAARFSRLNTTLRHKLEHYLGTPPNPANVPESFWQEAQDEMNRQASIALLLLWSQSAREHGLADELALSQGEIYAGGRAGALASDFISNTRRGLNDYALAWTPETSQSGLVSILGPERAARFAMTETTKAQTAGGEAGIGQTVGLSGEDLWRTRRDTRVCPICDELDGEPRAVWQAQFPTGPGDDVHKNCRCFIRYANVPGAI